MATAAALESEMMAALGSAAENQGPPAPPPTALVPDDGPPTPAAGGGDAPPPPAAPVAPAAPPAPTFFDRLKKFGIEGDFENEDAALEHLASEAKRARQQEGWANLGIQYSELQKTPRWQEYLKTLQQGQPSTAAPAAAGPGSPAQQAAAAFNWQAPEFNPNWLNLVQYDDAGNLVGVPGADPTLPGKVLAWQQFQRDQIASLARNPYEYMKPVLEHHLSGQQTQIQQLVATMVRDILAQQEVSQFANKALEEVESWAWQKGRDGRPTVDATGRRVLSEQGYTYYQAMEELSSLPPQMRHQYALLRAGRGPSPSPASAAGAPPAPPTPPPAAPAAPPPPTPQQLNEEAKDRFTNRIPPGGGYNPPRAGSFSGPNGAADEPIDESNLFDRMRAALQDAGALN